MRSRIEACELGDEMKVLVDLARERFGFDLPVIRVNEHNENDPFRDEDDYRPDYSGEYVIDTRKLVECLDCDDLLVGNIRYVAYILEDALDGKAHHYSSRKYTFGDTPDWWDAITTDDIEGRKVIQIDVSVYY